MPFFPTGFSMIKFFTLPSIYLHVKQLHFKGIGRVGLMASILSIILGMHIVLCLQLALIHLGWLPSEILVDRTDKTLQMAMQWTAYVIFLCTFHLGEFFTTAIFNPSVASSDSFMVNHSKAYTTAALVSIK